MKRVTNPTDLAVNLVALLLVIVFALGAATAHAQVYCCILGDNGNGTVDMPPPCLDGYVGDLTLTEGLPVGSTIELDVMLRDFLGNEVAGGSLGGTTNLFDATLQLQLVGTGALAGFNRQLFVPVSGQMDFGPRTPGDAVQDFAGALLLMGGALFGDPDFCTFEVLAGNDAGLPSPGHTTLTRLGGPGTDFQVDSFFDVSYRIEFQGCPGSILEGMGGLDYGQERLLTCLEPVPVQNRSWSAVRSLYE